MHHRCVIWRKSCHICKEMLIKSTHRLIHLLISVNRLTFSQSTANCREKSVTLCCSQQYLTNNLNSCLSFLSVSSCSLPNLSPSQPLLSGFFSPPFSDLRVDSLHFMPPCPMAFYSYVMMKKNVRVGIEAILHAARWATWQKHWQKREPHAAAGDCNIWLDECICLVPNVSL